MKKSKAKLKVEQERAKLILVGENELGSNPCLELFSLPFVFS